MPRPKSFGWQNLQPSAGVPPGQVPPNSGRRRKRFLLAGLLVGGLTGLTVLVVLLLSWSEYPNLVLIAPGSTTLAVPDNTGGSTTVHNIAEFCQAGRRRPHLNAPPLTDTRNRDDWKTHLRPARGGGLVVYFSAAGSADRDGPFLWWPPVDSTLPLTEGDKLRVSEILTELKALSGPKLLVFDLTPGALPWAADGACPDFARALKERDAELVAVPELVVICSVDDEETPWHSDATEDLCSIFGRYFSQAIRGVGQSGNSVVTAASAYDWTKNRVNEWSRKRRAVSQTPLLLPMQQGSDRATAMTLTRVPPDKPMPPGAPLAPPIQHRESLEAEWSAAEKQLVNPEQFDPETYKLYLGWRLRWEQLIRDNLPVGHVPQTVSDLRNRLVRTGEITIPSVSLSVPQTLTPTERLDVDRLWASANHAARLAEWNKQTANSPRAEHARILSERLCEKLDSVGYTPANLTKAVEVLDVVEAGINQRPVETLFLRQLARHLDPLNPPPPATLKRAVALSRLAEQAAWSGLKQGQAEGVFRWIRLRMEEADRDRRLGEDLLFAGDSAAHAEALPHFAQAEAGYQECLQNGAVIAEALALRSQVLVRLPFYARWIADSHRSTRRHESATLDRWQNSAETTFAKVHELDGMLNTPPVEATLRATALAKVKALVAEITPAYRSVIDAYETEVTTLLQAAETQPENWHALDVAVGVPFLSQDRRSRLFEKLERITRELDQLGEPLGNPPAPVATNTIAARHIALARAALGAMQSELAPTDGSSSLAIRETSDKLGQRFRAIPDLVKADLQKVADAKPFALAEGPLGSAARRTRLADPSAPVSVPVDAVLAEHRFWRSRLLLWQADRAIADGWADVGRKSVVVLANQVIDTTSWYSTRTAQSLIDAARISVLGILASASAEQTTRLSADCQEAATHRPHVVVPFSAANYTVIKDYPRWSFAFDVLERTPIASAKPQLGLPSAWVVLPEESRAVNPEKTSPREVYRGGGKSGLHSYRTPERVTLGQQELHSNVLYRGHLAQSTTTMTFTGEPTVEYIHRPPQGDAQLAVIADENVLGGAVVILVDRSGSMKWTENSELRDPTRTAMAMQGLEKLIASIPTGTYFTVGGFYLTGQTPVVEVAAGPVKLDLAQRVEKLGLKPADLEAVSGAGTPIAWSIEQVLDKERGAKFWPPNYTGPRSVVVLTDGADNFEIKRQQKPEKTILAAMNRKDHDTHLHLVFFAMEAEEEAKAVQQFDSLTNATIFARGKLPVKLWTKVKNGEEFAEKLKQQFRPRVTYSRVGGTSADSGLITATDSNSGTGNSEPSPLLPAGEYQLKSGAWESPIVLEPGDRMLLKVRKGRGAGYDMLFPPAAYDLSPPIQRSLSTGDNPLRFSIPRMTWAGTSADLALTLALERNSTADQKLRQFHRPLFPWFDVSDPAKPGTLPRVRFENDPALIAPAWNARLENWDTSGDQTLALKMPKITGYWIDHTVLESATPTIVGTIRARDISELPTEAAKGVYARKIKTQDGTRLVLEVDYALPGQFPYLQADWASNPPQQRHAYYDPQHRYTVTFGPLKADQVNREIAFRVYSIADLRRTAAAATVELPPMKSSNKGNDATANLRFSATTK